MKNAFLKKFLCVLSAAVLVFSFAACGNDADEKDTTAPSVLEEENPGADEVPDVSAFFGKGEDRSGISRNENSVAYEIEQRSPARQLPAKTPMNGAGDNRENRRHKHRRKEIGTCIHRFMKTFFRVFRQ